MIFTVKDASTGKSIDIEVTESGNGIEIRPVGFGTVDMKDGTSGPIWIEVVDGSPVIHTWPDINSDESQQVWLGGASEKLRRGRNARFWVWENDGWTKLTLQVGQELSFCSGGRHEEGYHNTVTTWKHAGDKVMCATESHWRDCDGPGQSHSVYECPLDRLSGLKPVLDLEEWRPRPLRYIVGNDDVVGTPQWVRTGEGQRDHFAESMNY